MKLKGFIFDLDGTLINSIPVVRSSLRNTMQKYSGRLLTDSELSRILGPTEDGIFKKLYPQNWQECLQHYLDEYDRIHIDYADPFPRVTDALNLLQQKGVKLAIVSGKGPGSMKISLRHSGLEGYFETIVTGSDQGASKPEHIRQVLKSWGFTPQEVAYIGDIAYDVEAAREVGVLALSALWAETVQVEKVLNMKPDQAFYDVNSFIRWIEERV